MSRYVAPAKFYDKIVDDDENIMFREIYNHLRDSEAKKRPRTDYMARVQKEIDMRMRALLIDWFVEVVEHHKLDPDVLYLSVNYLDRYLSANPMEIVKLQLLGVSCLMIASKYVNCYSPPMEFFCDLSSNAYSLLEILGMERILLRSLKFELTVPTARCFLERFGPVAQAITQDPLMELECLSNYLAELSLRDYGMIRYSPSLIAASSIFLARFILLPSTRPWNSTLHHFTLYKPRDLMGCVQALHSLCRDSPNASLPGIKLKYSQGKYNCVANKYCPLSIPRVYFQEL